MEAPMAIIGISPTVDIIFKLLFGNAQHPELRLESMKVQVNNATLFDIPYGIIVYNLI